MLGGLLLLLTSWGFKDRFILMYTFQSTVYSSRLECIPVQSPPVHSLSYVWSCSLGLSEVQTGIPLPPPPPHPRRHRCCQRCGWLIGAGSVATAGNVQYSSPDGPEGRQTLFIAVINTANTQAQ